MDIHLARGQRKFRLWWIVMSFGLMACKTTPTSEEMHDEGRYRNDDSGFQWQVISEQEFVEKALVPRIGPVKGLPLNDPMRQRLQFWIDQLDLFLREKDPVAMVNVPKPQIFLFENVAPNAFVASLEVCLNRSGQLQGSDGAPADLLGIDRELGGIFSVPSPRLCVKTPYQGAELQKFLNWYLKPFSNCTARVSNREAVFSPGCSSVSIDGPQSPGQTKEVFVRVSTHWISVTTGLIKGLTEFEAVYTLFHEAAHYYMAHLANPNSLYEYFYPLGSANPANKPLAEPKLAEIGKELVYWLKAKQTGSRKIAAGAPGQRYQSGLYVVARNAISDWTRKEGTKPACKDLSKYFVETTSLSRFPLEAPDSNGQKAYLLYEKKLDACLLGLPLDAELQNRMVGYTRFVAPWSTKILVGVPAFTSVRQLWDWLDQKLPEVMEAPQTKLVEVSRRADEVGLGQYTSEQEADELAVEWLIKFGMDPFNGVTASLKLLKIEAEFPSLPTSVGAYTYEQCVQAYATQFRAADGEEIRVPVGDYSDPHHSGCYRAFNMNREIAAHDYRRKLGPLRVLPPSPVWEAIVK